MIVEIIKLIRVKHYLKNGLIFLPIFFSGLFFTNNLLFVVIAFLSFSLMASTVYVINDINDVESDKLHKIKCERPIASGKISIKKAKVIATVLLMASIILNSIISSDNIYSFIILIIYT